MVTMADVARLAGVSVTTVSHVINGTRPASERTTRAGKAAIERTGYSQNVVARALARRRTQSLGLAISGLSNPYFTDVIASVEAAATGAGHTLLLAETHDDPEQELRVVRALIERRVDGLLLAPSPGTAELALRYLATQDTPVVLIDRFVEGAALDQVGSENEAPTRELVAHLIENGHRRIGMVVGIAGLSTTAERVRGHRAALRAAGLQPDPALIAGGGSHADRAREATDLLLGLDDPPTALVSGNNHMTIGVLRALKARGMRVPEDIALVAFDDFEWADLFAPRLTVVAQPTKRLGERGVELLLSRLEEPGLEPRTERLEAGFVHRDSCGCGARLRRGA